MQQMYSMFNSVSLTIEARNVQSIERDICGVHIGKAWLLYGESDRNNARTCANIGYNRRQTTSKQITNNL